MGAVVYEYVTFNPPPPSSFFNVIFFIEDRELYFLDVLSLVIVDRQELILYEYMACDGRGVRSKSARWLKNRIILNK